MKRLISRRDFLKLAGISSAALLGAGFRPLGQNLAEPRAFAPAPQMDMGGEFMPDAEIDITAAEKTVQILSGAQTRVWSYEGSLKDGSSGVTVTNLPGNYLGPIIRAQSGTKVRINFHNNLAEDSVIHPHGLRVPEACDGTPMQAIAPGETKIYEFEVVDPACPAWFHPHPHMRTAEQVYMGMAGLFYVTDPAEELAVPGAATGANDLPVIIQDRTFDSTNQFLYQPNNMWGMLGSTILVNGKPNQVFSLEPRGYRLRILNGSNARSYKLAWSNGMPVKVIGTDGGLLPAVASRSYVMLMPGERIDVWADFKSAAGKQVILKSLSFTPGSMGGGGGGMMGSGMDGGGMGGGGMGGGGGGGGGMMGGLANGTAFNILTVNVSRKAASAPVLGPLPAISESYDSMNVMNFDSPVPFQLDMRMMVWTINGRVFEMDMSTIADDEMVYKDVPIAWEWYNNSPIPHPMHIHSVQFRVIERKTAWSFSGYSTVNQGFVDSGWKDTVSVWPGEKVKIAMRFTHYSGMYMYHCHILEHEDMTMMRNMMVMDPMMPPM
jgi:FtsP/CotA-like multicopper oxidase with cupredoxin domain